MFSEKSRVHAPAVEATDGARAGRAATGRAGAEGV